MNARLFRSVFALSMALTLVSCSEPWAPGDSPPKTISQKIKGSWGEDRFLSGVNYPWLNYGIDFGLPNAWGHHGISKPESAALVKRDFETLQAHGVKVVRWNLFADCRASPDFSEDGLVAGLDQYFYPDVDNAIALAKAHDLSLIFVLLDQTFADKAKIVNNLQLGGRAGIVNDHDGRSSFLYNALVPLFQRYAGDKTIIGWELISNPEHHTFMPGPGDDEGKRFSFEEMKSFLKEAADLAKEHATQPFTIGNVSYAYLKTWAELEMDYMQSWAPLRNTEGEIRAPRSQLPVLVSSIPSRDSELKTADLLDETFAAGYQGAFVWSFRDSGTDSSAPQKAPAFLEWFRAPTPE